MAKDDTFIGDFARLLELIPSNYSLPQWQFAYRQVLYSMGMKILENFPTVIVGPDPSGLQVPGPKPEVKTGGPGSLGQTGGGHPSAICELACAALGIGSPGA